MSPVSNNPGSRIGGLLRARVRQDYRSEIDFAALHSSPPAVLLSVVGGAYLTTEVN